MNKLTLSQIQFVKKKIQNFLLLPNSPNRASPPIKNEKSKESPRGKISQKQSKNFSSKSKSKTKDSANDEYRKKENQILQFIIRQNRNKQSILNQFLNSDKIHLKKRQNIQQENQSPQNKLTFSHFRQELQQQKQNNEDKNNLSIDHSFSELKKVYKSIGNYFGKNQGQKAKQQKQPDDNPLFRLLQKVDSVQQMDSIKPVQKPKNVLIEAQPVILKPSAMKGRVSFNENPTNNISSNKDSKSSQKPINQSNNFQRDVNGSRSKLINTNKTIDMGNKKQNNSIQKSPSQLSFEKRNKSLSLSNVKEKQNQYSNIRIKQSKLNNTHNDQKIQKNSFQRSQKNQLQGTSLFNIKRFQTDRKNQNKKSISPKKKQHSSSPYTRDYRINGFPASVYTKSFKRNQYQLSAQKKHLIEKYKTKQLSPDERKNLKTKYQLLDKRLQTILTSLKKQKQETDLNRSCGSFNDIDYMNHSPKKAHIPQEIMMYHKLSPLKKLMKINKELKIKIEDQQRLG